MNTSGSRQMKTLLMIVTMISFGIALTAAITKSPMKIKKCCPQYQQLYLDDSDTLKCANVTRDSKIYDKTLNHLRDDKNKSGIQEEPENGEKRGLAEMDLTGNVTDEKLIDCKENVLKCEKDIHGMGEIQEDVWWIPQNLQLVRMKNKSRLYRIENERPTQENFIFNSPIPCFGGKPELIILESNVFIDIDKSELVLTETERLTEYNVKETNTFRKKRSETDINEHDAKNDVSTDGQVNKRTRKTNTISQKRINEEETNRVRKKRNEANLNGNNDKQSIVNPVDFEVTTNSQRSEDRIKGLVNDLEIVPNRQDHVHPIPKITSTFQADDYCIDRIEFKTEANEEMEEEFKEGNTSADEIPTNDGNNTLNDVTYEDAEDSNEASHVILLCPCLGKSNGVVCVRKCCPDGRMLHVPHNGDRNAHCGSQDGVGATELGTSSDPTLVFTSDIASERLHSVPHYITHGTPRCQHGSYLLPGDVPPPYRILLNSSVSLTSSGCNVAASQYCIDSIHYTATGRRSDGNILLCRPPPTSDQSLRRVVYTTCFIVGTTFLVLTLLVYAVLTELRKSVHSWNIISHVACSIVAYVAIVIANLYTIQYPSLCVLLAYVIQTSFLSSQLWLNAMCIDIAFTFSGLRAPRGRNFSDLDRKKFLYYSCYTWGTTALIGGLTVAADQSNLLASDSPLKPNFGVKNCWFKDSMALAVFFYGPIGLLLLVNLVLFHYTCWKIRAAQKETAITTAHRHVGGRTEDQTRLTTFIKLFLLMGVTWSFEILSWSVGGPRYLWYLTDLLNVLRGVFIFLILCCKRHVIGLIKKRVQHGRRNLSLGPRSSSRPRTRSESTNSRRHSKSSITTEQVALSRLNLNCNNYQDRIQEEEERPEGEGYESEEASPPFVLGRVEEEGEKC